MLRGIKLMNPKLADKVENNLDNILQEEFGMSYEQFVESGEKDKWTSDDFFEVG